MLATLRIYHDRVQALADEAEGLLRREGMAALPRMGKLRVDQGVAMASYQLFVHRQVFEPLTRNGTPAQAEAAKRLKVECVIFSGTFCRYVQDWSKRDTATHWHEYLPAALGMVAAIRSHIARVRDEIAPTFDAGVTGAVPVKAAR